MKQLERQERIKEIGKHVIEIIEASKELEAKLDHWKNKKKKIVDELVEYLGNELDKTYSIDFPEKNIRVVVRGYDSKTFEKEIQDKLNEINSESKERAKKLKTIAEVGNLFTTSRTFRVMLKPIRKEKEVN